jgi:hypothetical protein
MTRLRGHFDGQRIILDEAAPSELKPDTPVEVVVLKSRQQLLREYEADMKAWWEQPLPPDFKPQGRQWKREDC